MASPHESNPVHHARRMVAFLDVLGFSRLTQELGLVRLHDRFSALIDQVQAEVFGPEARPGEPNFEYARFHSDSIVLVSRSLSCHTATSSFMLGVASLLAKCFGARMPVRGAIGLGDVLLDSTRDVFLSDVLPLLVKQESRQQWAGCFLLAECEEHVVGELMGVPVYRGHETPDRSWPLLPYIVPAKSELGRRWCVNWPYLASRIDLANGFSYLNEEKVAGTKKFVSFVESLHDPTHELPPALAPAKYVRLFGTYPQFNLIFLDEHHNHVDPPPGSQIGFELMTRPDGRGLHFRLHPRGS